MKIWKLMELKIILLILLLTTNIFLLIIEGRGVLSKCLQRPEESFSESMFVYLSVSATVFIGVKIEIDIVYLA